MDKKLLIEEGKTFLGIELGSTRIKGVLIDEKELPWRREATNGKTSMWTAYGPIPWRMSGKVCRAAIRTC